MATTKIQNYKNSCLLHALTYGYPDKVGRSLADGADPNVRGGQFSNCALELVILGDPDQRVRNIKALMSYGANPNLVDRGVKGQMSPFMRACTRGDEKSASAMMDAVGLHQVDLLCSDEFGWLATTATGLSASVEFMAKIQSHFERNVLPTRPDLERGHLWMRENRSGRNAFMLTSIPENWQWIMSQNFLKPCDLMEKVDKDGKTALWIAVSNLDGNTVNSLLEHGAKTNVTDTSGKSLLEMAARLIAPADKNCLHDRIVSMLKSVDASRAAMASVEEMIASCTKAAPVLRGVCV